MPGMPVVLALFLAWHAQAASLEFKTTWRTTSTNEAIMLPFAGDTSMTVFIDWGDDYRESRSTIPPPVHTYNTAGYYNVTINDTIKNFRFDSQGHTAKLIDISDWGGFEIGPNDMNIFAGCSNLRVSAPPNTQPVMLPGATLKGMFKNAASFNSPLSWDLANVTSLASMFEGATQFNQPLNFSNTNNVISMKMMFYGAASFNQPIEFDTRSVTDMSLMFLNAFNFNQSVNFNTSKVIFMNGMFTSTIKFNQPVNFDTSNVQAMSFMFQSASSFNQPVNFDTKNVSDMGSMFSSATKFNQPINFDTRGVVAMGYMFYRASSFNQPVNFTDTSRVQSMSSMFAFASQFNQPVNFLDSGVTDTSSMFDSAIQFNQPVNLDTRNVVDMAAMFRNASSFNQLVNFTNTSNVVNMYEMFSGATLFNQPVDFDTRNVQMMNSMFKSARAFNQRISFNASSVIRTDFMFANATAFNSPVNLTNSLSLTTTSSMFQGAVSFDRALNLQTDNVGEMYNMFNDARKFNQPVNFNTSNAYSMNGMFAFASKFNQPVNFDTRTVTDTSAMFQSATSFNQPIDFHAPSLSMTEFMFADASAFNSPVKITDSSGLISTASMFRAAVSFNRALELKTDSVTIMNSMFEGAGSFNQPVNFSMSMVQNATRMFASATNFNQAVNVDTRKVQSMDFMFAYATQFNQPVIFDTRNVQTMNSMFDSASQFNQPINFTTEAVINMNGMFRNASSFNQSVVFSSTSNVQTMNSMFASAIKFNQPVAFDTRNVTTVSGMFQSASSFNQPVNFDTRNVLDMTSMFEGASNFNQTVNFNTSQVTSMKAMFAFATKFNQTVTFSSVASVTDMTSMFANVSSGFEQNLGSWNTSLVTSCSQFCYSCGLPSFPQCQPCAPWSRLRRLNATMDVCNCPHNDCNGQVSIPLNGSGSTVVVVDPSNNRSTATVYIPPGGIFQNGSVLVSINPGSNATFSNSVVSLVLQNSTGQLVNVSNLSTPVSIVFELKRPLSAVSQCEGTSYVIAPVLPTCGFLNESNNNEWETSGCSVASFNSTHVQCNCTHFTLFAVLSPKHNKLVPTAVLMLSPANVSANPTGLVSVLVLLCLFAVVFVVAALRDRAERAEYEQLRLAKREKWDNFVAENKRTTLWKQVKIAFQKRHTWFSLVFRKSGTSFRAVDRTFVTLLMAFASMSTSAFYHAQDNDDIARVTAIVISVIVSMVPCQLLVLVFVRTGPLGFYEEWEQSRRPPQTNKCLRYRFPDHWRYVWRGGTLLVVIGLMIFVLIMSMNFDRQPFYFCRGKAALAWVSTWLVTYAVSVFLVEPLRIVLLALMMFYKENSRVHSVSTRELIPLENPKVLEEQNEVEAH